MDIFTEWLTRTASTITQLTIIGSALMWLYNRFIGIPREKHRIEEANKRAKERDEYLAQMLNPLSEQITKLGSNITESEQDRKQLNEVTKDHELRLDDHERRIIRVETKLDSSGQQRLDYTEYYGGNLDETK